MILMFPRQFVWTMILSTILNCQFTEGIHSFKKCFFVCVNLLLWEKFSSQQTSRKRWILWALWEKEPITENCFKLQTKVCNKNWNWDLSMKKTPENFIIVECQKVHLESILFSFTALSISCFLCGRVFTNPVGYITQAIT